MKLKITIINTEKKLLFYYYWLDIKIHKEEEELINTL